jgi:hypothetical protein
LDRSLSTQYQRKQGRDMFDLATALKNPTVKPERIAAAFSEYIRKDGLRVTRAQFEKNIAVKLDDPAFAADIGPLLAAGFIWDIKTAAPVVSSRLIKRLAGDPWKGEGG